MIAPDWASACSRSMVMSSATIENARGKNRIAIAAETIEKTANASQNAGRLTNAPSHRPACEDPEAQIGFSRQGFSRNRNRSRRDLEAWSQASGDSNCD